MGATQPDDPPLKRTSCIPIFLNFILLAQSAVAASSLRFSLDIHFLRSESFKTKQNREQPKTNATNGSVVVQLVPHC